MFHFVLFMTNGPAGTDKLLLYQLLLVSEVIALGELINFPGISVLTPDLAVNQGLFSYLHVATKTYIPWFLSVEKSPRWPQCYFTLTRFYFCS